METGTTPSCLATRRSEWILFLRGPLVGANVGGAPDHGVRVARRRHCGDDGPSPSRGSSRGERRDQIRQGFRWVRGRCERRAQLDRGQPRHWPSTVLRTDLRDRRPDRAQHSHRWSHSERRVRDGLLPSTKSTEQARQGLIQTIVGGEVVPALNGMDEATAASTLGKTSLKLEVNPPRSKDATATVESQNPNRGASAPKGSPVQVKLAPTPTPAPPSPET